MDAVSPGDRGVADVAVRAGADYVVGVQNVLDGMSPNTVHECIPSVSTDDIWKEIESLNNECNELSRVVARQSLCWLHGPVRHGITDTGYLVFVCSDGTDDRWAEPFVTIISKRIPGVKVVSGSICDLANLHDETLIVVVGRQVKPHDRAEVTHVIRNIPVGHMICINFGALWLLPLTGEHPTLLGGDTLTVTQTAAALVLMENRETSGDPDLV